MRVFSVSQSLSEAHRETTYGKSESNRLRNLREANLQQQLEISASSIALVNPQRFNELFNVFFAERFSRHSGYSTVACKQVLADGCDVRWFSVDAGGFKINNERLLFRVND
jgi:hypothetical protein